MQDGGGLIVHIFSLHSHLLRKVPKGTIISKGQWPNKMLCVSLFWCYYSNPVSCSVCMCISVFLSWCVWRRRCPHCEEAKERTDWTKVGRKGSVQERKSMYTAEMWDVPLLRTIFSLNFFTDHSKFSDLTAIWLAFTKNQTTDQKLCGCES